MLSSLLLLGIVLGGASVPTETPETPKCDLAVFQIYGYCPEPQANGTEIIIDAILSDTGGRRIANADPSVDSTIPNISQPKPRDLEFEECVAEWDDGRSCFLNPDDADAAEEAVEIPPVTITDVAHFAPDEAVLAGEPENVGVAGLPTNFVAEASVHTVDGELFGFPVTVRFTPVAFDFTFGDGESATTTSGGALWAELDQAQFTPTATSHTYSDRGTYAASVNVRYTAEVDFGIGWFPISGEVTDTGPAQEIRIYEAHTALVAYTCDEAPTSPGC